MNKFIARYYENDKKLLDITIESWHEYVYTLKNSDEVKVGTKYYAVEKICMNHDGSGENGMVIYLDVNLTQIDKDQENTVKTVGNYYNR